MMRAWLALLICIFSGSVHGQEMQPVSARVERVSKYVTAFLEQFSQVKCTENVTQAKLTPKGSTEYSEESRFDYLVIMQGSEGDLLLSESRLQEKEAKRSKQLPMLVTNGFSTLFLVFHPYYRDGFTFLVTGEEMVGAKKFVRIRFDHILGTRTPIALAVRGREFPLELTGSALVDDDTGAIVNMEAGLVAPMDDIGLRGLKTTVDYASLPGKAEDPIFRFPVVASVDVQTLKQHWRNSHRFTDYKRFSVNTEVTLADKK